MSVAKSSAKFINSLNTKCLGCLERQSNRFAHMLPGGCMSKLESGIEWVQDPEEEEDYIEEDDYIKEANYIKEEDLIKGKKDTEKEDNTKEETYDKTNNRSSFSTYSQYADIEEKDKNENKKNSYEVEELIFHMDDIEDYRPNIDYHDYLNGQYKLIK